MQTLRSSRSPRILSSARIAAPRHLRAAGLAVACALCLSVGSPVAMATGISYDAITNMTAPTTVTQSAANWLAEDITLAGGSSLTVGSIDFSTRLGSGASVASFTGFLRVGIFSNQVVFPSGTRPGNALWQADISATWTRGQTLNLTADVGQLTLPSSSIWIGWSFLNSSGATINASATNLWVMQNTSGPSVGLTASSYATSPSGTSWSVQGAGGASPFALRINALPTPGAASVLVLGAIAAGRRRR
ncbi:MAG: hypothetical protein K2X32_07585 [Phycisphaerales bacterium]|nr:hypothetical protein [Phycisphaerales bacterium]